MANNIFSLPASFRLVSLHLCSFWLVKCMMVSLNTSLPDDPFELDYLTHPVLPCIPIRWHFKPFHYFYLTYGTLLTHLGRLLLVLPIGRFPFDSVLTVKFGFGYSWAILEHCWEQPFLSVPYLTYSSFSFSYMMAWLYFSSKAKNKES